MNKSIFIHAGHGGNDRGAIYNGLIERDINIKIRDRLLAKLEKYKDINIYVMEKDMQDITHTSNEVINQANSILADLNIDIHCNAGGGVGFETYVGKSGLCDYVGNIFCENMKKYCGSKIRGVKKKTTSNGKDFYYFIRELRNPSMILETAFIDNDNDINLLNDNVIENVANAYRDTILEHFNIIKKDENSNKKECKNKTLYRVQVGAFEIKENAETLAEVLHSLGYDTIIKEEIISERED